MFLNFKNFINESIEIDFKSWKRKNVTLRGIKTLGEDNGVYGSWGKGLYTVPLGNKSMAKQYGDLYFVVNAIPKKPKIVNTLNDAEIFRQKLIIDFSKKHKREDEYDQRFFNKNTTMEQELLNLGFDGFIIKGREYVNYNPVNIQYFKSEDDLFNFYKSLTNVK